MIPRYGRPPLKGQHYKLRPGAYAVLPLNSALLVTKQHLPVAEFQLPGGGIDPGESPVQALHREVLEETGWTIAKPIRLGAFRRFTYMEEYDLWAEKLCTIYLAKPVRQVSSPREIDHSACIMGIENALNLLENDGDRSFVYDALRRGLLR